MEHVLQHLVFDSHRKSEEGGEDEEESEQFKKLLAFDRQGGDPLTIYVRYMELSDIHAEDAAVIIPAYQDNLMVSKGRREEERGGRSNVMVVVVVVVIELETIWCLCVVAERHDDRHLKCWSSDGQAGCE